MFLRQLPVGAKIRENKSGFVFLVAEHSEYSDEGTILAADNAIAYMAFDAAESKSPIEENRLYGNSDYTLSNIHAWLNSEEENWYKPTHDFDTPPVAENTTEGDRHYFDLPFYAPDAKYTGDHSYADKPGFLTNFAPDFVKMIYDTDVSCDVLKAPGKTERTVITAKVFLPSLTELGLKEKGDEGVSIELFEDARMLFISPDPRVIGKEKGYIYKDASWWYWTRTPITGAYCLTARMEPGHRGGDENDASIGYTSCRNISGVRPLLRLYSGAPVSDTPDEDGVYEFLPAKYWVAKKNAPLKRWTWTQEVAFNIPEDMGHNPKCPCHNTSCPRNGFCKACSVFHKEMDHSQFCKHGEVD